MSAQTTTSSMTNHFVGIEEPALRPVDRLTGFGNRRRLMTDLARAVAPDSPPSVLAIFDLGGFKQYQRVLGYQAGDDLIAQMAPVFERAVGDAGSCYRPREDEFVTLIGGLQDDASTLLDAVAEALRQEGDAYLVTSSFGSARLPEEAGEPIAALALADRRLGAKTNRPSRDRRQQSR